MKQFVHLHVHTEYSLLDGAARIKKLISKAKELNMPAAAITDHGVMYGVIDFYREALKAGIKPIIGCEVYVAPRKLTDKIANMDVSPNHLVLLAKNMEGYRNLTKLVSLGFTEGFYYKPRIDKEVLAQHSRGLIALSGCVAGGIAQSILNDQWEKAISTTAFFQETFGPDNFYLELQNHGFEEQRKVNQGLLKIHQELSVPLVATNDVHYVNKEDALLQDILLCIQTGKTLQEENRMKFESEELYLKSYEEMNLLFGEMPEALNNTLKIAERINLNFEFGKLYMPQYSVPESYTIDSFLEKICLEGFKDRYGNTDIVANTISADNIDNINNADNLNAGQRLKYELEIIKQMGYSGYFLIVWDFIRYAREKNILVGPGRGSAAGSLVSYVLGITNIDPLKYDLIFERFLNPERVSPPDIDIDLCYERRGEVIDYIVKKYGEDKVCQIITFGTMAAKAAIRDVGRVMNLPYSEVDKVAKLIPAELGITIRKALETSIQLKELYEQNEIIKKLIDNAEALEGMPRHASTHAAGVVIAQKPLTEYLPLYKTQDGYVTTQFAKETVEDIGLLKMDLLGLRTLTVIGKAVKLIADNKNNKIDMDQIPLDEVKTFNMLVNGQAVGVFQLESSGMRNILKELKPEKFEDIVALVALYRPGPLGSGMVEDFIQRKHGLVQIDYFHPDLQPILQNSYGVILYQEQVMRIAQVMAGYSMGQADSLRKAMGKKNSEMMKLHRQWFLYGSAVDGKNEPLKKPIAGAIKKGYSQELANKIFDLMEYFAGYGFNLSHSAAYALVSYQTAYLKANYPVEYMAALITSIQDNSDKVAFYVNECKNNGIDILPPDINESGKDFTVVGNSIRFGLTAVKMVGESAVINIIKNRREPFLSFEDFLDKIDLEFINRRMLESLVKVGAFASLGHKRSQLLAILDESMEIAQKIKRDRASGQLSLLDIWSLDKSVPLQLSVPNLKEFPNKELLAMEKEMIGFYISGHPLLDYQDFLKKVGALPLADIKEKGDHSRIIFGGIITSLKQITSRKGEPMAFANMEDLSSSIEVVVFPQVYQKYFSILRQEKPLLVKGRVSRGDEEIKILAEDLFLLPEEQLGELFLKIDQVRTNKLPKEVEHILREYPGFSPVYFYFSANKKLVKAKERLWVNPCGQLIDDLEQLLGAQSVKIKEVI